MSEEIIISVKNLTKDYGQGRGIFDVSFDIPKGATFGYCGTNGSGKTTTIRHIMGFLKPDKGEVKVKGLDAYKNAEDIMPYIGYVPGEIAFPDVETGTEFLNIQASMFGITDMSKAEEVINALQLDPTANLRRMSKGMKQKTALVAAFMRQPEILLLDEPTTGLDPLMRKAFIDLIKEEKAKGTTIFMSNHMFDELEETCDYVAFIKDGHIIDIVDMKEIHSRPFREYEIVFSDDESYKEADTSQVEVLERDERKRRIVVKVDLYKTDGMIRELRKRNIKSIIERQYTLEKYFLEHVKGGNENGTSK
jgi:ABC-2 type transport system ATP-binding protein